MANIGQTRDAFNPEAGDVNPQNYLGWSKPIQQPAAGQGTEALLKGVATGFTDVAKVANFYQEHTAIDEAMAKGTALRDEYVSDLKAARDSLIQPAIPGQAAPPINTKTFHAGDSLITPEEGSSGDPNVPQAVKNLPAQISTLGSARGNNKISETDYKGRVDTLLKDLRSRYPGYRPQIDATMEHATGVAGANSYAQSLVQDINSYIGKKDEEKGKVLTELYKNEVIGGLGASWNKVVTDVHNNVPGAMDRARNLIAPIWAQEFKFKQMHNYLTEQNLTREALSHAAESDQGTKAYNISTRRTDALVFAGDNGEKKIADIAGRYQRGEVQISEPDAQRMIQIVANDRNEAIKEYQAEVNRRRPNPDGSIGQSLAEMNPGKVAEGEAKAVAGHDHLIKLLNDKDIGAVYQVEQRKRLQRDSDYTKIVGSDAGYVIRLADAIRFAGGDNAFMAIADKLAIDGRVVTALRTSLDKSLLGRDMPSGTPGAPKDNNYKDWTLNDSFNEMKDYMRSKNIPLDSDTAKMVFNGFVQAGEAIADKNTSPKERERMEQAVFHPEMVKFLKQFHVDGKDPSGKDVPGRYNVLGRWSSNDMLSTIWGEGDRNWQRYKTWFDQGFQDLFRDGISNLRAGIESKPELTGVKYHYNNQTNELFATDENNDPNTPRAQMVQKELNNLNTGLRAMGRVARQENKDPEAAIMGQFVALGRMDPSNIAGTTASVMKAIKASRDEEALKAKAIREKHLVP